MTKTVLHVCEVPRRVILVEKESRRVVARVCRVGAWMEERVKRMQHFSAVGRGYRDGPK